MNTEQFRPINLDKLNSDAPLSLDDLIFSDEAKELKRKILDSRKNGNTSCYFISGVRGAGKSTFLKALQEDLDKHPHFRHLFHIDPSELDENEHFFFYVISKLKRHIDADLTKEDAGECEINDTLGKMAEGLLALSHPLMKDTDFVDANLYLKNAVNRYNSSADLKEEFGHLMSSLKYAACSRKKSFYSGGRIQFFITIDDADMNPAKCYEITECIRKYMLNEHLFFIFTGDLKLYSMVIRGNQMDHFTRQAWQYDSKGEAARFAMLESIGTQYLLKMFPVDNRVHLPSPKRIFDKEERYAFTYTNASTETPVSRCVEQFLKSAVGEDRIPQWKSFIEDLPLRSALQLLGNFTRSSKGHNENEQKNADYAAKSLMLVFSSIFHLHDIDVESIHLRNLQALFHACLPILTNERTQQLLEDGYSKRYPFSEQILSLYLNTEISRQTMQPTGKLLWMCSIYPYLEAVKAGIPNVHPCYPSAVHAESLGFHREASLNNENMLPYAQWGNDITAIVVAWAQKTGHTPCGFVEVPYSVVEMLYPSTPRATGIKEMDTNILLQHALCSLSGTNGKHYYFSIFSLISFIISCIENGDRADSMGDTSRRLSCVLATPTSIPSSKQLFSREGARSITPVQDETLSQAKENRNSQRQIIMDFRRNLIQEIQVWAQQYKNQSTASGPHIYAKAWQRFLQFASTPTYLERHLTELSPKDQFDLSVHLFFKQFQNFAHSFESQAEAESTHDVFANIKDMLLSHHLIRQTQTPPESAHDSCSSVRDMLLSHPLIHHIKQNYSDEALLRSISHRYRRHRFFRSFLILYCFIAIILFALLYFHFFY